MRGGGGGGGGGGSKTTFATRSLVSPWATLRLRSTLDLLLSLASADSSVSTLSLLDLLMTGEELASQTEVNKGVNRWEQILDILSSNHFEFGHVLGGV